MQPSKCRCGKYFSSSRVCFCGLYLDLASQQQQSYFHQTKMEDEKLRPTQRNLGCYPIRIPPKEQLVLKFKQVLQGDYTDYKFRLTAASTAEHSSTLEEAEGRYRHFKRRNSNNDCYDGEEEESSQEETEIALVLQRMGRRNRSASCHSGTKKACTGDDDT
eukprot:gb/GECG01014684.1/.p1 GENE.gb/GECG01014684.1/~~gb/GECG01014684.1/.p1  ORF type:complete len:161 (+),score=21.23 gb/GECG01014684.1/:1-483(+)